MTKISIDIICDESEIISVGVNIDATYCRITPWKWDKFVQIVYKII